MLNEMGESFKMIKGGDHWLVRMAGDQHQDCLCGTPFIKKNSVFVHKIKMIRDGIYIYFKETLNGHPDRGYEPLAEGITITALIALVSVGQQKAIGLSVQHCMQVHCFTNFQLIAKKRLQV